MARKVKTNVVDYSKMTEEEKRNARLREAYSLGLKFMEMLSKYGCSTDGLNIEAFALAMAWAALQKVAFSENIDPRETFENYTSMCLEVMDDNPSFEM